MKDASSHSVSSTEMIPLIAGSNQLPSSENQSQDMKSISVPPMNQLPSSENPSRDMESITEMNSTSILQMTDADNVSGQSVSGQSVLGQSSVSGQSVLGQSSVQGQSVSGQTKSSLSIIDLPLTQEKVESTYADVFQGLGKFPGEPYKLRLKPDVVPAKHRPRKVPVHLQEAFHEEVE